MKTWIKRTLIGVAALVVVAVVAVFGLATLGDRKLERQVDVAVVAVPLVGDAASVERGGYLFRSRGCGDCHGMDGSGGVVVEDGESMLIRAPNLTGGPGSVDPRLQAGRLGARHPPRRQAERPAGTHHAERGIQPLHRCRPRGGRRLHPPAAAEGRRRRHHPPAAAGARDLRRGRVQGRVGEDRPSPAAGAAGRRRRERGPWRLCRQRLHRLPSRRPERRQDRRCAAGLAGRGAPRPGRRQRDGPLSGRRARLPPCSRPASGPTAARSAR